MAPVQTGSGAVWQRAAFGTQRSGVQIPPSRPSWARSPVVAIGFHPRNMRTGRADLPLHTGKAPAWLFGRMKLLAREMSIAIVHEEGPHGLMDRLSDPF